MFLCWSAPPDLVSLVSGSGRAGTPSPGPVPSADQASLVTTAASALEIGGGTARYRGDLESRLAGGASRDGLGEHLDNETCQNEPTRLEAEASRRQNDDGHIASAFLHV